MMTMLMTTHAASGAHRSSQPMAADSDTSAHRALSTFTVIEVVIVNNNVVDDYMTWSCGHVLWS